MTLEQIARDFGIRAVTLSNWLSLDAIDAGTKAGKTAADNAELLRARRVVADLAARTKRRCPTTASSISWSSAVSGRFRRVPDSHFGDGDPARMPHVMGRPSGHTTSNTSPVLWRRRDR